MASQELLIHRSSQRGEQLPPTHPQPFCANYTYMLLSIDDSVAEDKPKHEGWLTQERL
jgi:hypothetical protein